MNSNIIEIVILYLLTFAVSWGAARILISYGPKDKPNSGHKIQKKPMPTSGGIAVAIAVVFASAGLMLFQPGWISTTLVAVFFGSFCMFLMGVWDDVANLPAIPKLLVQVVLSLGVAFFGARVEFLDLGRQYFELGAVFGILGSAAWLVVVTNAVNFMDGSDGLATGCSAFIAAGLAFLAALTGQWDIAALAGIFCAGLLGLLVWNGRGKLFAGDAGALFFGFFLGCLSLILVARLEASVWIAPCLFIAFLADVLLTLIWRFRNGRSLLQPHREHVYQLLISMDRSQVLVAWIYVWISMHGLLVAGVSLVFPRGGAMLGFILLVAILFWLSHKVRRTAIENEKLVP